MSWIEKVKNGMRITTGDGKQWTPDWMNASYQQEYHITEHHWIDVGGSYVDRKKPLGTRYRIEIHFQGPDHIETSRAFLKSSNDNRAWLIEHPLYDLLTVQPTGLEFDNAEDKLNTTKVTGTVIETLEDAPFSNFLKSTADGVFEQFDQVAESAAQSVTAIPDSTDVNRMADANLKSYRTGVNIITDTLDASKYTQAFNTAATFINSATATPLLAMRSAIALIQLPGAFKAEMNSRLKVLFTTFESLRANLIGLTTLSSRQIFAAQQSALHVINYFPVLFNLQQFIKTDFVQIH